MTDEEIWNSEAPARLAYAIRKFGDIGPKEKGFADLLLEDVAIVARMEADNARMRKALEILAHPSQWFRPEETNRTTWYDYNSSPITIARAGLGRE